MNKKAKNDTIVGIVDDKIFHVLLDNTDETVLGYLSFNICRNRIPILLLGNRVKIQINGSYSKKGKIFFDRFPTPSKSKKIDYWVSKKTRLEKSKNDHQAIENTTSTESLLNTETTNPISSDSPQSKDQKNSKDTTPNQD